MPRRAKIEFVSLKSSLVNLPISVYGPLVEHHVRPQNLAVHLLLVSSVTRKLEEKQKQVYVGWTGLASASSLAHFRGGSGASTGDTLETIEIDPQFAGSLGLHLGDIVEIGLLHDLPTAKAVVTEPYSVDDWEIIELHAGYVEQNLLSQVRVACVGQEVDVWVFGRTRARLRVVSFEPASGKHEAVLLGTDTEVSIAPKKRAVANGKAPLSDAASQLNGAPSKTPKYVKYARRRALPPSLFMFSDTQEASSEDQSDITAWVSPGTFWAFAFPNGDKPPLAPADAFGPLYLRTLKPPVDPLADDSSANSAQSTTQTSRVIHSAESSKQQTAEEKVGAKPELVVLRWSGAVPDFHVVFEGYTEVKDWESCYLLSSAPSKLSKATDPEGFTLPKRAVRKPSHDLIGIDETLHECTESLKVKYIIYRLIDQEFRSASGILVSGRLGSGKTVVAKAVAKALEDSEFYAHTIYVDFAKYVGERVQRLRAFFNYLYDKAHWHKPSLLVIDNMDKLLSAEVEHADSFRSRQLAEIFIGVFTHRPPGFEARDIVIMATAESDAALHPRIMQCHLFRGVIKLKSPTQEARRQILSHAVQQRLDSAPELVIHEEDPVNYTLLATQTEGYLPTDMRDLVSRAVHLAAIRATKEPRDGKTVLTSEDFEAAQKDFVPMSLKDIKLQHSDVTWADIGGLRETRKVLRETLEWPTKYAAIFAKCPLRLRSGILLYGYPGCGKTLLASAVAKECGLNFISVKGPELLNKYIGASEKSVRDIFERASAAKPCVLFFDEFDSIAPKRGHDSTGVTDRVVNQMLTQMDGAEGLDGVYVLAATSRPDLIDPALLRPGRLDKSLLCDMPGLEEREEILKVVSRKISASPNVNWSTLAVETEGYSGADLQAMVYNAHLDAVHETLERQQQEQEQEQEQADELMPSVNGKGKGKEKAPVDLPMSLAKQGDALIEYISFGGTDKDGEGSGPQHRSKDDEAKIQRKLRLALDMYMTQMGGAKKDANAAKPKRQIQPLEDEHFRRALASTRPSVSREEQARLRFIYDAFLSSREGNMSVPPDTGPVGSRATLM